MDENENNNDPEVVFVNEIVDFIRGRYFFTFYCQYQNDHNSILSRKWLKNCVLMALILTVVTGFCELSVLEICRNLESDDLKGESMSKVVQRNATNPHSALKNAKEALRNLQGQVADQGSISVMFGWLVSLVKLFFWRYSAYLLCSIVFLHLLPILVYICQTLLLRHLIANYKNKLILGLFRFIRVRPRI